MTEKEKMGKLIEKIHAMLKAEGAESFFVCASKNDLNHFTAGGPIETLLRDVLIELYSLDREKGSAVVAALLVSVREIFGFEGARGGEVH